MGDLHPLMTAWRFLQPLLFGEHATILCHLGLQRLQPLLHGLQIVAQPNAANPER